MRKRPGDSRAGSRLLHLFSATKVSAKMASSVRSAYRSIASPACRRRRLEIICSPFKRLSSSQPSHERLVVAMSGGVDSSVAAHLLRQSHPTADILGLHMSNWDASDEDGGGKDDGSDTSTFCVQSEKEASDAQEVCDALHIPMHRASFAAEYWTGVFEPFVEGIDKGRMPNPDVGCNSIVKFGAMRDYALDRLQADWIATGHYARLWHRNVESLSIRTSGTTTAQMMEMPDFLEEATADAPEREWIATWGVKDGVDVSSAASPSLLLAGADLSKDQSYFLCGVNGHAFRNVLFPLGDLLKKTSDEISNDNDGAKSHNKSVRDIAIEASLPTATKRESMGICFIGKRNFQSFISQYLPSMPQAGNFVDVDTGEIVGKHEGASHFTIGQGAKISGASRKWFIVGRADGEDNNEGTVSVCGDTHHPALYSNELYIGANEFNWIGGTLPPPIASGQRLPALCRTRHLQPLIPCNIELDQTETNSRIVVRFDRPVRAITPGQTAAIYVGGGSICLGGGQITSAGPSFHQLGLELPRMLHPAGQNDLSTARRASGM